MAINKSQKGVSLIITFFTPLYLFFIGRVRAMNNARRVKMLNSESGVSLIITFFIMIIILAVVLFVSTLLYSQVKIIKNIGDSMVSLYAADSGVEKILFFDRQVLPEVSTGVLCDADNPCVLGDCNSGVCKVPAARGLCAIFDLSACIPNPTPFNPSAIDSLYCNDQVAPQIYNAVAGSEHGCDIDVCNNCQISFDTTFDNRKYYATASVFPSSDGNSTDFEIKSRGTFNAAARQIKITISAVQPQGAIIIKNACANPKSTSQGTKIDISAEITATIAGDTIGQVLVSIHDAQGNPAPAGTNLPLTLISGSQTSGTWRLSDGWTGSSSKAYYVDIEVADNLAQQNIVKVKNIPPYPLCLTTL